MKYAADPTHYQSCKENPRQVDVGLTSGYGDNGSRGRHRRHAAHNALKAMQERGQVAGAFIGLVEEGFVCLRQTQSLLSGSVFSI